MLECSIAVETLNGEAPVRLSLQASSEECRHLAERFGWQEVSSIEAELVLRSLSGDAYLVSGKLNAGIIQTCRITGAAVPEVIEAVVEERFANMNGSDETIDIDDVTTEALENGTIPVGEMLAQLLALEANPWPRDPEALLPYGVSPGENAAGPMAALAELKKKL